MAFIPTLLRRLTPAAILALGLGAALPLAAQNPFEDVARVDDRAITRFEWVQREKFLQVLRTPGVTPDLAMQALINDRLKLSAAKEAGIVPSADEIRFGMENFAGRANLTIEEFLAALDQVGIAEETLRDYVTVLLAWGETVRERFGARARPSEEEIDRALALGSPSSGTSVQVAEIVLPITPQLAAISEERADAISRMTGFSEFETAARQYSISPSASRGGRLDWMPLSKLPPRVGPLFLTMKPGEVTPPLVSEVGIVLFQFRALQDHRPPLSGNATLDYMRLRLPAGADMAAERARLAISADRCDDLFGVYFGAPEEQLSRDMQPRSALPRDVAAVLDLLDPGEIGTLGNSLIMLCARSQTSDEDQSREDVQRELFSKRLESYGDAYLEERRADAHIEILK
ncbi:MAG: peptidylprolyl isomerase [Rhodobacteraceae bacterium]|nr:peptidylprolyl isomerase [Paracoccaceae bacterium]